VHWIENPRVGGSIPPQATKSKPLIPNRIKGFFVSGSFDIGLVW
jgi:hypothetical protein